MIWTFLTKTGFWVDFWKIQVQFQFFSVNGPKYQKFWFYQWNQIIILFGLYDCQSVTSHGKFDFKLIFRFFFKLCEIVTSEIRVLVPWMLFGLKEKWHSNWVSTWINCTRDQWLYGTCPEYFWVLVGVK